MLQLPKFSLQSFVDLRYLCNSKKGDGKESIGPDEVIKLITSGSVLHHLTYLDLTRCSFLSQEQILSILLHFFSSLFCFVLFFLLTKSHLATSLKSCLSMDFLNYGNLKTLPFPFLFFFAYFLFHHFCFHVFFFFFDKYLVLQNHTWQPR